MSFWSNLFGGKKRRRRSHRSSDRSSDLTATPAAEATQAAPAASAPSEWQDKGVVSARPLRADNAVWVIDQYGRQLAMSVQEWRSGVLPHNLSSNWEAPDELARIIRLALEFGCATDVLPAARHLYEIDQDRPRAVFLLAETLMRSGHDLEAERMLDFYVEQHGEHALVHTARGILEFARGRRLPAERLLWRSLELDPNGESAFRWFLGVLNRTGGEKVELEGLARVAALLGSWRAELTLAWVALKDKNLEKALQHSATSLEKAPRPAPSDLLEGFANIFFAQGYLLEMINLVGPHFDAKTHGLPVGAALIKAHLDLGQIDFAARILTQLREAKTPFTESALNYWEAQIVESRYDIADPVQMTPDLLSYLIFEGPIWLERASSAAELFPAKTLDGPTVAILPFSVEPPADREQFPRESKIALSVCSGSLALFLAEQMEFHTTARALVITPWIRDVGIPASPEAITDARAAAVARNAPAKIDFVVTGHFRSEGKLWPVEVRLVRVADGKQIGVVQSVLDIQRTDNTYNEISAWLRKAALAETAAKPIHPPGQYRLPTEIDFTRYMTSCDDLLMLRCARDTHASGELWLGERATIERALLLAVEYPRNVAIRILLAQIVYVMRAVRPTVPPEFKEKLTLLQREHPLSEPTNSVVQRMFDAARA